MKETKETSYPGSGPGKENAPEQERIREIAKRSRQFVVISGPSGSGKTMAIKHLVDNYGFIEPPFLTTRELRPGEKEIGGTRIDQDEFAKKEAEQKIFLPARNYGNAYGYDLDTIFQISAEGNNIVVESPAANLTAYVSEFLPESTVIGMLPVDAGELKEQLARRGLNSDEDRKIRLQNSEIEKRQIVEASKSINIFQIVPTHGIPQNTISQIDRLMRKKGFKTKK